MKKRILFNMYNLEIGGAEKSLLSILNTIDYSRYNVDLFLYENSGELINELPEEVNLLSEIDTYKTLCESTKFTFKRGYIKLGVIRTISKYLSIIKKTPLAYDQYMNDLSNKILPNIDGEYDIAISNIWPHNLVTDKVKAKKKIGWIHTDYSKMRIDYKRDFKTLDKLDYIVSVSDNCKEIFDNIQPKLKEKSILIENIVSSSFIKDLSEKEIIEKELFKDNKLKILTVARLHPEKGVDRVVEVCEKLSDDGIDFKWFVVGFGAQEQELLDRAKDLKLDDRFYILGKKINPYPYFKKCDIYVQPSRYEGKAVAITEAKVFNKPIVITDYNSARDQITNNETGLIVNNSIDGIYKGIKELIEDSELKNKIIKNLKKHKWSNEEPIRKSCYKSFKW